MGARRGALCVAPVKGTGSPGPPATFLSTLGIGGWSANDKRAGVFWLRRAAASGDVDLDASLPGTARIHIPFCGSSP
jgi:hypothetical protein